MKKKFVLFFSIIIFIFFFDKILFHLLQTWEKKFYQNKNFQNRFIKFPGNTYDTLIMGSSRSHKGIHAYYLFKYLNLRAKNFAHSACSAQFNYLFYKKYKKFAKIPDVVIYGVDYFIFSLNSNPRWLQYFEQSKSHSTINKEGIFSLIKNKKQIDSFLNNVINRINNKISNNFRLKKKHRGYIDDFTGFPGKIISKKTEKRHFRKIDYTEYPGKEGKYFRKLMEVLNKDNVTVFLVYIPDYIGTYKTNYQKNKLREDIRKITKKFNNVYILDFNNPEIFPLRNKNFFLDGDFGNMNSHLSRNGARVFNRMLTKRIRKILQRRHI